ncbi:MAG: M14 family zinc carboxypeptidase, partial [Syntrophobacteraceae bacterium]
SPASEPETIAIQEYLGAIFSKQVQSPVGGSGSSSRSGTFLDIHSYGGLVYWPWGSSSDPPPDAMALQSMGRKLAYFTGYHPEQSSTMYYTDGESEDFAYGEIGVAAFCIEVGTEFFEECDEFENVILQPNLEALIYAAKASRSPYEIPRGPDIAAIDLSNHETGFLLNVLVDARGYSNVNGTETVRKIAGAELYIDTPPWIESATPFPLSAVDGRFDSAVEQASAVIGSIPLAPGQHILYVRGYNSDGEFGAVSAVFFQKTGAHEFIELLLLQ